LQQAIDDRRALALRYYTATRDETTERTVDPMRVFELDGRSYLEAWCRRAEGMRVFRVDRIDQADVLDEPANPPPEAELRDLTDGVFTPAPEHMLVVVRVEPAYAWVADYYVPESETIDADGRRQISLRVADPAWVRALALGSFGHVEVLSPEWLAESVRDEARSALAAYSA
jgi:proteasome accessory factor C